MKNPDHLSHRDLERLSAYLDGEVSKKEADNLEARLHNEPELRAGLEALRTTTTLLRGLPEISPPRDLTLTPEMVGIKPRRPYPVLRLATALVSLVFVALVGLDAITTALPMSGSMASAPDMRDLDHTGEMMAEAPLAPEPGALPAEDNGTADEQEGFFGAEQDATPMFQMTEEAIERSESMMDVTGTPTEVPLKCCVKTIMPLVVSIPVEEPAPANGETQVEIEPVPDESDRASGILALPGWRIGLRIGEILFGIAAVVMVSFVLWTRRK
jgi:hypothetical protein